MKKKSKPRARESDRHHKPGRNSDLTIVDSLFVGSKDGIEITPDDVWDEDSEPLEILIENSDLSELRPTAVYDNLDAEGELEAEDGKDEGAVDDLRFAGLQYSKKFVEKVGSDGEAFGEFKYKKLVVPSNEEMDFLTRKLVPEQKQILNKVIHACKQVKRSPFTKFSASIMRTLL